MYVACASVCYRGYAEDEVAALLEDAPAAGYQDVEIHGPATWSPEAIAALDPAALRARLDAAGLRCLGIYPPGYGGADEAQAAARAEVLARAIGHVEALGAEYIVTSGATGRGEGNLHRVIACVQQTLALTPDSSVKIVLENHYGNVLEQAEDYARVFDAVDNLRVGMCVDTGHFHAAEVDTPALIRQFGSRVYDVHLKDHLGKQSVGLGRGEVDLQAVVAALQEVGYAGALTVELEHPDKENTRLYVREAYQYLMELIADR